MEAEYPIMESDVRMRLIFRGAAPVNKLPRDYASDSTRKPRKEDRMQRSLAGMFFIAALLMSASHAMAGEVDAAKQRVGILACTIVPYSGINLLIHSVRQIRCEFKPRDGGPIERYKGETGISLGIDVNIDRHTSFRYSVLAHYFQPGTHQLAGKYSGVGGHVTLGLSLGNTAPIGKRDGSITLQPISGNRSAAGAAAGFNYLYLEADK